MPLPVFEFRAIALLFANDAVVSTKGLPSGAVAVLSAIFKVLGPTVFLKYTFVPGVNP